MQCLLDSKLESLDGIEPLRSFLYVLDGEGPNQVFSQDQWDGKWDEKLEVFVYIAVYTGYLFCQEYTLNISSMRTYHTPEQVLIALDPVFHSILYHSLLD